MSAKLLAFATLFSLLSGFTPNLGLDSFEVYLNDKLVLQQYVNQPESQRQLELEGALPEDQLQITYRHCTTKGSGSDRVIQLKDQKGEVLKAWHFDNDPASNTVMSLSVGGLLKLAKAYPDARLRLYYTAKELPEGMLLAALQFGPEQAAVN